MSQGENDYGQIKQALMELIPRLRRFGYALTGNRDDGDDLTQITLERALMRLDQFQPGTRLESWVFRIAQNAWIDEVRARKRRGTAVDVETTPDLGGDDGRAIAHGQLDLAEVRRAMGQLSDEHRAVLTLVAIEGFSYQEAADLLGVPIGSVMSRLSRARLALAKILKRREGDNV